MDGLYGAAQPWVGVLGAFGVAVAFVVWLLLRGAAELSRKIAAVVGGTLLAGLLVSTSYSVARLAAVLVGFDFPEARRDRGIAALLFALIGIAVGMYAVFAAHRLLGYEDDDEDDDDDLADDEGDDDIDDVLDAEDDDDLDEPSRRRGLLPGPLWVDVAALTLAIAVPTDLDTFSLRGFGERGPIDVTVAAAVYHLFFGLLAALPLLVVARDDVDDVPLFGAAFGLIAAGKVVLPIWPDAFANEFWSAFAMGVALGLLAAVTFSLLQRALPVDRKTATAGVAVTIVLALLSAVLSSWMARDQQQEFAEQLREHHDGVLDEQLSR